MCSSSGRQGLWGWGIGGAAGTLSSVLGVPGCPAQSSSDCRGTLMVAEVASRFEDTRAFLKAMTQLGFKNVSKVCPQVCPGLGAQGTREPREGAHWGCVECGASQGLVKAD